MGHRVHTRTDDFAGLVQRFFAEYLAAQRNLSPHTRLSYRNTFRLLLHFLAEHHRRSIDQLTLAALTPEAILSFLDHLERTRRNSPRTRNVRLAAIRTFVRYVLGTAALDFLGPGQRILAIPQKKSSRTPLGFMTREEIKAVLAAVDQSSWAGRRDLLLFTLLYNTGARISEALQVRARDVHDGVVHLHGKGRKDREVPLWPQNALRLSRWCAANKIAPDQLVFPNRFGGPLSHDGVSCRLELAVKRAAIPCPSLKGRRITSHRFRNSCAMALLQTGVPLEMIALYLSHARPITTHAYVEADLKMKADCLRRLTAPEIRKHKQRDEQSRLLAFLEAVR